MQHPKTSGMGREPRPLCRRRTPAPIRRCCPTCRPCAPGGTPLGAPCGPRRASAPARRTSRPGRPCGSARRRLALADGQVSGLLQVGTQRRGQPLVDRLAQCDPPLHDLLDPLAVGARTRRPHDLLGQRDAAVRRGGARAANRSARSLAGSFFRHSLGTRRCSQRTWSRSLPVAPADDATRAPPVTRVPPSTPTITAMAGVRRVCSCRFLVFGDRDSPGQEGSCARPMAPTSGQCSGCVRNPRTRRTTEHAWPS